MTNPARVRGFLDVFGAWDPTLAFVMGSAVLVMAVAWRIRRRMGTPLFAERFSLPDRKDLHGRLITGPILFGVGWGLAGLCPGPAVSPPALSPPSFRPFVVSMLSGLGLSRFLTPHQNGRPAC